MKKFVISLLACFLIFAGYYVYKNKNRLYNKFKYRNTTDMVIYDDGKVEPLSTNTADTSSQLKDLISTVQQLTDLNKKLEEMNNGHVDSIYSLHVVIDSLNNVIASKPKLKIQSHPFESENPTPVQPVVNKTNTNKKIKTLKNEKNLPIARGRDAVELKEFFTERYDHRR
jgi:hypothetical protein